MLAAGWTSSICVSSDLDGPTRRTGLSCSLKPAAPSAAGAAATTGLLQLPAAPVQSGWCHGAAACRVCSAVAAGGAAGCCRGQGQQEAEKPGDCQAQHDQGAQGEPQLYTPASISLLAGTVYVV